MRTSSTGRLFLLVCVAVLVGACVDYHTAEECQYTGTCPLPCPLPDAGDGGDVTMDDAGGGH
jgi:hypothetical protein